LGTEGDRGSDLAVVSGIISADTTIKGIVASRADKNVVASITA